MYKIASSGLICLFLTGLVFSQGYFSEKNHLTKAQNLLLETLLKFPSPSENRSEIIESWVKRENEKLSSKTNIIPPDDAPAEKIIKFWSGKRPFDVPKPSEKTQAILFDAVKKDHSLLTSLVNFLPTDNQSVEAIKDIVLNIETQEDQTYLSNSYELKKWLKFNGDYKRDELISAVKEIQKDLDNNDKHEGTNRDEELRALAKLDWETAYPFIHSYWGNSKTRISTLALTLLYKRAVEENTTDVENFREQLKQIVTDKNSKGYSRNAALESLMRTEWKNRDEWFISLFSDETLNSFSDGSYSYEPLSSVVEENPDYWVPKIIELLNTDNKITFDAATSALAKFQDFRAREDAMKALLPYLNDTDDWKYTDSYGAIYSLNFIYLPESIPVLKRIVQTEEGSTREYAAEALGVKYKAADAAAMLEKALLDEQDASHQEGIIQGLVHCGGLSDKKKIEAIEFFLQNEPDAEEFFSGERNPLIGLGLYLSKFESTNEEFTKTLFNYAVEIRKKKPVIAAKIRSLIFTWNNYQANNALIKNIEENNYTAEDILTAIQKRESIRTDFNGVISSWIANGGIKAGIAAVILEDKNEIEKIIAGNDIKAQIFLFASAKITEKFAPLPPEIGFLIRGTNIDVQVKLPLENVKSLFARNDKILSSAIKKYLEADDTENARKLILSQHKGEAVITGRRLPKQFGEDNKDLDEWEEKFRREILTDKNLEEIYAFSSIAVRVRKGKAEVTVTNKDFETGKTSEEKYFLSEDQLAKLKNGFAKTNPFAMKPISIPSNSCWTPPFSSEFLYLTRDGGVRVYIATPFGVGGNDNYLSLMNFWDSLE